MKDMKFYGSSTVGERGQIVLPAKLRTDFSIKKGDKLLVIGNIPLFQRAELTGMKDIAGEHGNCVQFRMEQAVHIVKICFEWIACLLVNRHDVFRGSERIEPLSRLIIIVIELYCIFRNNDNDIARMETEGAKDSEVKARQKAGEKEIAAIRERADRYEGNATMVILDGRTGKEKGSFALPAPADDCF